MAAPMHRDTAREKVVNKAHAFENLDRDIFLAISLSRQARDDG